MAASQEASAAHQTPRFRGGANLRAGAVAPLSVAAPAAAKAWRGRNGTPGRRHAPKNTTGLVHGHEPRLPHRRTCVDRARERPPPLNSNAPPRSLRHARGSGRSSSARQRQCLWQPSPSQVRPNLLTAARFHRQRLRQAWPVRQPPLAARSPLRARHPPLAARSPLRARAPM